MTRGNPIGIDRSYGATLRHARTANGSGRHDVELAYAPDGSLLRLRIPF